MRTNEAKLSATTGIDHEGGGVAGELSAPATDVFDHCVLAAKLARLISLYPQSRLIAEPYTVFQYRQVVMPASRPIAIDTRRPIAIDTRLPLLEAS